MKNLLTLVILGAIAYYGYQQFFNQPVGAFDEQGNPRTLLFLFDGCGPPCDNAEKLLKRKEVAYERINLSSGPEAEAKLKNMGGGRAMPILFVGARRIDSFHRQRFGEALAETYGFKILDALDREVLSTHFNADGNPKIVMYGAAWCPYCKQARVYFQSNNIPFTEWDVEKQSEGKRNYDVLQGTGYPLIYVGFRRFQGVDLNGVEKAIKEHPSI